MEEAAFHTGIDIRSEQFVPGLVGLVLHKKLEAIFGSPTIVAVALILNGFVLLAGDVMSKRAKGKVTLERLGWGTAFASISLLMRYFKQAEVKALRPFVYYCIAAGVLSLVLLTVFA